MFKLKLSAMAALAALLSGACSPIPFAPMAVPDATSIRPQAVQRRSATCEQLMELHMVTPAEYIIKPQDVFSIIIDTDPSMNRPGVTVMPDGSVSLAPIGYVKLAGLTLPQAGELLSSKFREYIRDCNVYLEPVEIKPYTFSIAGSVTEPGVYPFAFGNFCLRDAVATAKGLAVSGNTQQGMDKYLLADLDNAYIVRGGEILPIDFVKALDEGDPLYNIPIMDSDYIYIPSLEGGKITVLGEVDSPGCFPYQPNMTLVQSIGMAEGLKETYSPTIKVIRGGLVNPNVYNVNIKDIQMGRMMDFPLAPKDIVYIPRDGVSDWNYIIRQILPSVQFINGLAGPFGSPSMLYKN